ncbi:DUF255 domain-containing protein [Phycisphaerales bacterium AB-hyl4]|uniref:DUF255 domain-containing protein n=1 Tax=Natronomicrosphaera hydrolytica TaxID=3242702 RepID=A0ABV4TZZ2_9BACT
MAEYTNRLVNETSPYLLQHAHNPVDWYPWGEEAFEAARREGKPIFLSVGYSTCYWCHVMERQVFEHERFAEQMNASFVNVKVDREERPDVDDLYMTAVQLMTQRGGWPMSVFLTPPSPEAGADAGGYGLKPFWAGTYLPPEPSHGMPSFGQVLEGLSSAWRDRREEVLAQASQVASAVREQLRHRDLSGSVDVDVVQTAANRLLGVYDAEHGGFGSAPKFPQPSQLAFLLAVRRNSDSGSVEQALLHTLDRMARGGIYDQLGGGFHRYSVDEQWLVPHFEKMLYDNGQLVELYADAYARWPGHSLAGQWARVMRETCDYVLREMTDGSGALWSAQDAEVEAREGGNYVWTREEVEQAIGDEALAAVAVRMFGLDRGTNFRDPHSPDAQPVNVLFLPQSLDVLATELKEPMESLLEKRRRIMRVLKEVRDGRPQPSTDDKVLVSWNGMMIAGLARAGAVLDEAGYLDAAERAAEAIMEQMSDGEGLRHTMRRGDARLPAYLEDYAFFVHGLLALHRAERGDGRYLERAQHYTKYAAEHFKAPGGGYYDTLADQEDLFVRLRSTYDGVIPSANSQMAHNLIELYSLSDERAYLERAADDLFAFGAALRERGPAMLHMMHALMRLIEIDPALLRASAEVRAAGGAARPQVVSATVETQRVDMAAGEVEVAVSVKVEQGHHLNAARVDDERLVATELAVEPGDAWEMEVAYPAGTLRELAYAEEPVHVYEGQVVIGARLRRVGGEGDSGEVRLRLRYQACSDRACMEAEELVLPVKVGA